MNINWLHLSDIHFKYENYDTLRMRNGLIKHLKSFNGKLDFIVITGDITYRGAKYSDGVIKFFDNLLKATGLSKDNLYIIPGNHDIKREELRGHIINGILNCDNPIEKINKLDRKTYNTLLKNQKSFFEFYEKYFGTKYDSESLHYVVKTDKYNIIALNTCLVSGNDEEEGKLLMGLQKLNNILLSIQKSEVVNIAIGHHSIECFNPMESKKLINLMVDTNVDMYLSGHVHRPNFNFEKNNINDIFMAVCGSNVVDDYSTAGFIINSLNIDKGDGTATFYKWYSDEECWDVHAGFSRSAPGGVLPIKINRINNTIDTAKEVVIDEDDFKEFILDFQSYIDTKKEVSMNFEPKDIKDKFEKMLCNSSFQKQFDNASGYFPYINEIMNSPVYIETDRKFVLPNVIISEYNSVFDECSNGNQILEKITNRLYDEYKDRINYPESRLKAYIKILVFWTIHECDIFNEDKR